MSAVTHCNAGSDREKQRFPWGDAAIVLVVTLGAAVLSASIDLNETVFDATRAWEHLQVDEVPATLLVLACGLAWFSWRRYTEARRELTARRQAELELAALLREHRDLAQQYVHFQESERKALARELHDELGQYLNAIKTDAVSIQSKVAANESVARAASAIVAHSDHLQTIVRGLIGRLRPVGLDVLGLQAALEHLLDDAQRRAPDCRIEVCFNGALDDLDEDVSLTIYRLVQEALTNVARYSEARHFAALIERKTTGGDDVLEVQLTDDGRGTNLTQQTLGLGLRGMRERVEMLEGELTIASTPGQGFSIRARVPTQRPAHHFGHPAHLDAAA